MDLVKSGTKRIHVGGLTSSVTEQEIKEKFSSFGTIKDIEIKNKKDINGGDFNTFAYIDIVADESSIKKCFSIFNKAKWKGRTLQIQYAKQHFLKRLEEERNTPEAPKIKKVRSNFHDPLAQLPDVEDFNVKGKVPGTPIPGEKKWIVGKYGRVLPIVNVRNRLTNKCLYVDPSKFCHNVKKIKPDNQDENEKLDIKKLTWVMEISEDSDKLKQRRGDFSDLCNFNTKKKKVDNDWSEEMAEKIEELRRRYITTDEKDNDKNNDIEVVKVKGKKVVSQYHIPKEDFIYDSDVDIPENGDNDVGSVITDSDDSVGSADTDEIIASMNASKQNVYSKAITKSLDPDIANSKPNPKKFSAINNATPVISYVDKTMKMTPFKGIGMLDLSDEGSKTLCSLSKASIKTCSFDERNGLPENVVEDIDKSKILHSKKKILKSKTKRDKSRKKIDSLDSENKHDSSETDSDSSEVSSRSRSIVEEKPAKKVLKITFDESNTEVNKRISQSSDNDSEDTDDIISKLKGKTNTKQNGKYSSPINVSVKSDSEYDTDDFEKIVNKFSSTLQADDNTKTIDEEDEKCSTAGDELSNASSSENSSNSNSEDNNDSKQISETEDVKEDSDASFIDGNEDALESSDNETKGHDKKKKRCYNRSEKLTKMKNEGDDNDHKDETDEDFKETRGIKDVVEGETENVFVSSSLVNAFTKIDKQSSSGFSFLKTFGKNDVTESQTEEIPLKLPWQLTSKYDEEEMIVKRGGDSSSSDVKSSFFFHPKDVRLQEGFEFFHRKMDLDHVEEIWQENRHLFLANCRQRNRLALRRVNQEKLRRKKLPFTASIWGKKK